MTREKIIEVTSELIKSDGVKQITIRKIADLAGTNVASVNYYFGSKDNLINEILRNHLASFRVVFDDLDKVELSPIQRLRTFLLNYASVLSAHPEVVKSILSQDQLFDSQLQYMHFMQSQGIEKLINTLREIVGPEEEKKVTFLLTQMFSAIFFSIVIRNITNPIMNAAILKEEQNIEEQVDLFLELYFYKYRENRS